MSSGLHTNNIAELPLSEADEKRLRADIKMFLGLSFGFSTVIVVLLGVIGFVVSLFVKLSEGFGHRAVLTIVGLYLPFVFMCCVCLLKYIDLKRGRKLRFTTYDYEIKRKGGNKIWLVVKDNEKRKMDLSENVAKKIVSGQPLIVEMVPISKTMVSLSHGEKNLLDS